MRNLTKPLRLAFYAFGIVFALSTIRLITGASDLTSAGTASAALLLSVPIAMAALGGLFSERSGVVNIGLEGMMIMGAWGGGFIGSKYGPWAGLVAGIFMGAVGALIHAIATVGFGVDHVVSGVAVNIIAAGLVRYFSTILYKNGTWLGPSQSPDINAIGTNGLPIFSGGNFFGWKSPDLFGAIAKKQWFLISDLFAILRGLTGEVSYVTMIAIALVPLSYWFLWHTAFGLRLRSAGEAPTAAESLGVNVYKMKYAGVLISGAFAGLGGAFLAIVAANHYQENQTGGRGYIGLAALIFGNWRPGGLMSGAALFGFADALQLRDAEAVHALLMLVAVAMIVFAILNFRKRKFVTVGISFAISILAITLYYKIAQLPGQFVTMTPYVMTLLVLSLGTQRLRMPAADGVPYRRGGGK
ncbi:MAG: ABC transporter permease [Actinomycetales bacterium]|nr:ABC transporter permease [Actinomycetales bacterium]